MLVLAISQDPYPLKEGPSPGAAGPDPDALPRPDVDPDALDKDADGKAPLLPGQDGAGDSNAAGDSDGPSFAIQRGTRVLISLWDSLMFGQVLKSTTIF